HPGEGLEQGRLTARVGPDDHGERAVGDLDRQPGSHGGLFVGEREVVGAQHRHAYLPFPRHSDASNQIRYSPPTHPVAVPTGSCAAGKSCCTTRSPAESSSAPTSAVVTRPGADERVSLRASCGAASATNEIGPAAATANAASSTLTPMSTVRSRPVCTPSAPAVSSPSSIIDSDRARDSATGSSTANVTAAATTCSQPRELTLPTSHACAVSASWRLARVMRNALAATASAFTPMPISTNRSPLTPRW